nr:PREDICTED: uncharacterized protein LOC105674298 [Linepithema humile]
MARVLLYERHVDAICINTHADLTCDGKIQNGVKIKEEIEEDPIDATLNINTTENCMLVRNCFNLIGSKSSPSENNISQKNNINNKENELTANSHSAYSSDVNKIINLKRKIVNTTEELVHDASSQSKKKRQSSNEIFNRNTSNAKSTSYGTTIDRFSEKRKLQKVAEKKKKLNHLECDICFRKFNSSFACEQHKYYYNFAVFKCSVCNKQYKTHDKLHEHIMTSHGKIARGSNCKPSSSYCNFCGRSFNEKLLLQSHLFHMHNELIYSSNRVKQLNLGSKNYVNTPQESTTLKIDAHEEQRSNNPVKELNTRLRNNDLIKTKGSTTEESSSHKMLSTKRLRQPTIQEYLELYKNKCDKHSPNKLNIKNGSSTFALHRDRQVKKSSNSRSTKDIKVELLSTKSSNSSKRMTHFTSEQNEKDDVSLAKKPFVKIHADVEMMKTFLDNLPDTAAKDNMNNDDTNKSILSYRELPYSLRSSRVIPFIQINLHSRSKSKDVSKTQSNAGRNIETKQIVTDLDFWKTNMIRFKCKDCIIPLIRCDENPQNNQISTNSATFKTNASLTVQRNSTSFRENNIQNKTVLKELEVSLERLAIFPAVDITKEEAILDAKKSNGDCFLCKICNKSFSSKLDKQMHIKSCHVAYMSSICNARYKRKRKLCDHYLQEHLFKLNQCCICYIILPNFIALEQHLNVHCIKYIQRKNDQHPIDKEINCKRNKEVNKLHHKYSHCKESSLSTLISHENHCVVQKEDEEDRNNSLKETSTSENLKFSDIVLKEHHNKNADKISEEQKVAYEKPHSALCENTNNDSTEKSNENQMSVIDENSVVANDLIVTEGIETANESQTSEKLPENNFPENSTINDQDIVNAQQDVVESDTKIALCIICGKQFHSHAKLQHHMRSFCNITDICPICNTGFSSKRFLRTHITAAHVPQFSKSYTFHCMFCNQGFFKKVELRSHVLHLHGQKMLNSLMNNSQPNQEESDKLNTTTCTVCYLVYETHDRYTEHMMYYYKNHIFTCSLCKQTFQGMYLFHNHYKLTHYSEDIRKSYTYICEICNEGFKHESHFYSHKMHVHLNEESSTEVAKRFEKRNPFDRKSEIRLQKPDFFTHLQKQIEQSSEYTCQICQTKCATVNYLKTHKAIYSNDGHFQCNNCSRRCRTSTLLEEHIKLTHTCRDIYNGHVCGTCGEVLETAISLKCHEKHFHSNNVTNADISNLQLVGDSYDCLFCDMDFSSASAVTMHIIRVHINKLLAKHPASKPSAVSNVQEQSIQQPEASSSENSQSQLLQQSVKIQNRWLKYLAKQKKKKIATKSSNQDKAILPEPSNIFQAILSEPSNQVNTVPSELPNQVKTVSSEPSNQGNSVLPESSNQVNTIPSEFPNQVKTVPSKPPNQGKPVLPESSNQVNTVPSELPNQVKTIPFKPLIQCKTILPKPSNQEKLYHLNHHTSPHINVFLPIRSTNNLSENDTSSNSGSANVFQVNQTSSLNESNNKSITLPSTSNGLKVVILPNLKTNKTVDKKLETVHSYTCPLCAVIYPSLMFFHAHLKYAHANSICKNPVDAQVYLSNQNISIVKCLLCPSIFTDEVTYKTHLKNFHTHYVYMPCFEKEKIDNANNPIAQTNNNRKTIIPEVITLDDNDNIENDSDKHTAEADAIPTTRPCEENDNKIGKLRVKSFAKIIENLSMDFALKSKETTFRENSVPSFEDIVNDKHRYENLK